MLGGGVGNGERAWCGGRDRTIVDDATAHGLLVFHHTESLTNAQEHAGQVGVDHPFPHVQTEFMNWDGRRAHPSVVEQQIDTAKYFHTLCKQIGHRVFLRDVGRNGQHLVIGVKRFGFCCHLFQIGQSTTRQDDGPAVFQQSQRRCFANARTSACHDGNF